MATCVVCHTTATVYCENDKAFLCTECDKTIHSSNAVAAKHVRCRVCEVCNQQRSTLYCMNDKVFCCDDCDGEIHTNNPLAANHKIVPASQAPGQDALTSGAHLDAGSPVVTEAHSAANCNGYGDAPQQHGRHDDQAATSHSNSDAMVPEVPVMEVVSSCDDFLASFPHDEGEDFHQQQQQRDAAAHDNGDITQAAADAAVAACGSIPGKPWKDFEALELDNGWLDRLEMGFDFSDILDNHHSDDAGLVPTLNPSFPEESGSGLQADSFPAVPDVSPNDFHHESSSPLKRSASLDLETFMPAFKVPFTGPPDSPSPSSSFDCVGNHLQGLAPTRAGLVVPQQVPVTQAPLAAAPVPQAIVAAAGSAALAAMEATSAAAAAHIASHPFLTREQRVQRYREKRSRRNFEKTIRYASRKAYAEVRPRIKGRFARKEEVLAWKAANPGMAVPEIIG